MIREKKGYAFKIKGRKENCTTPSIQHVAAKWKQRPSGWWEKNRQTVAVSATVASQRAGLIIDLIHFGFQSISEWWCVCVGRGGGGLQGWEDNVCVVIIVHIIRKGIFLEKMMLQTMSPKQKQMWDCTTMWHQSSNKVPKWQWPALLCGNMENITPATWSFLEHTNDYIKATVNRTWQVFAKE